MTDVQARLLALLVEDERRSIRELQALAGLSSTSVVEYNLRRLTEMGEINLGPRWKARSIRVRGRSHPAERVIEASRKWAAHDERLREALMEWDSKRG